MLNICGSQASLRTLITEDHPVIFDWKNDSELNFLILAHPLPFTLEMSKEWIEKNNNDKGQVLFGIVYNTDQAQLIGVVRLMFLDWINRNTELGIFIAKKDFQNKGIGKEVLRLVLKYAFTDLNLNRVFLRVASDNVKAIKLYESFGFIQEGILRQQVWRKGKYSDIIMMGVLKDEILNKL